MKSSANAHTTLYRKYRPEAFADVVGQDDIVSALSNAIKNNTLAHAYLFAGSRGTGKTSVARIFASEIGTHADDLYEIDAASNRGINEIRELRNGVSTLPFHSRFKVYIIDEVHMLTKEAFNALLKTLEEPPAHVIFILCTTDPEKLISTIRSRCNIIKLEKPNKESLIKNLENICKKENIYYDIQSLEIITKHSNESFRDSLTNLEKVTNTFSGKVITDNTEKIFGQNNLELYQEIISLLSVYKKAGVKIQ